MQTSACFQVNFDLLSSFIVTIVHLLVHHGININVKWAQDSQKQTLKNTTDQTHFDEKDIGNGTCHVPYMDIEFGNK